MSESSFEWKTWFSVKLEICSLAYNQPIKNLDGNKNKLTWICKASCVNVESTNQK